MVSTWKFAVSTISDGMRRNKYECDIIYLAYSPSINVFKLGITSNRFSRLKNLRSQGNVGVRDWEYHYARRVGFETAWSMEQKIAAQLKSHNKLMGYLNHSTSKACRELYQCDIRLFKAAFASVGLEIRIDSAVLRKGKKFEAKTPIGDFLVWVNIKAVQKAVRTYDNISPLLQLGTAPQLVKWANPDRQDY